MLGIEKKSKWIPLVAYNAEGNDYITFVRKGFKTGMIYFKTKNITPSMRCTYNFRGHNLFDIKEQFTKVLIFGSNT